jgi:hypothetical protein
MKEKRKEVEEMRKKVEYERKEVHGKGGERGESF